MEGEKNEALDLFTSEFKRLKARHPPPDFTGVLNLSSFQPPTLKTSTQCQDELTVCLYPVTKTDLVPVVGLKPCEEWKAYQFPSFPGFIIIENPFIDGYQRYWASRCLQDFPSAAENITNLSALGVEGSTELWKEFVLKKSASFSKQDPLRKLRWTTLGYHYDWTAKEYSENAKTKFPADVNCLSQYLAACLGFGPYCAEAAIVNYYHLDSTLAGHTDHSELDHSAPLFSISFGVTAIFMLGGSTKAVKPMSVYLRSGDVCIMSGPSRLAYHAVPKILTPSEGQPVLACFTAKLPGECKPTCRQTAHDLTTVPLPAMPNRNSGQLKENYVPVFIKTTDVDCTFSNPVNNKCVSTNVHCTLSNPVNNRCVSTDAVLSRISEMKDTCQCNICDVCNRPRSHPSFDYKATVHSLNSRIEEVLDRLDFTPFEVYLRSARINMNIRQVLPWGMTTLPNKQSCPEHESCVVKHGQREQSDHLSDMSSRGDANDIDLLRETVKKKRTDSC